jgi:hypothetical protein
MLLLLLLLPSPQQQHLLLLLLLLHHTHFTLACIGLHWAAASMAAMWCTYGAGPQPQSCAAADAIEHGVQSQCSTCKHLYLLAASSKAAAFATATDAARQLPSLLLLRTFRAFSMLRCPVPALGPASRSSLSLICPAATPSLSLVCHIPFLLSCLFALEAKGICVAT